MKSESIKSDIQNGITIICDRYAYSGVAYSNAKGLSLDWCKSPDKCLPKPDVVFYLSLPIDVIASRSSFGEEKYERVDFQKKVGESFKSISEDYWRIINGEDKVETIAKNIEAIYEGIIAHFDNNELGKLYS